MPPRGSITLEEARRLFPSEFEDAMRDEEPAPAREQSITQRERRSEMKRAPSGWHQVLFMLVLIRMHYNNQNFSEVTQRDPLKHEYV